VRHFTSIFVAKMNRNDSTENAEMYEIENCSAYASAIQNCVCPPSRAATYCTCTAVWRLKSKPATFYSHGDGSFELELISTERSFCFVQNLRKLSSFSYFALAVKIIRTIY